jgi:hypothetical protein
MTVISEIPAITSQEDERRQEKKLWISWATTGVVFATIVVGSAISYLRG